VSTKNKNTFNSFSFYILGDIDRQIYGVTKNLTQFLSTKTKFILFTRYCWIQFVHSFIVYSAVYQEQETGHGAHQDFCIVRNPSLSWGQIDRWLALEIHSHLALSLKKELCYATIHSMDFNNLLQCA